MRTLLEILIGYYAADLFVGLYHMLTDKGWNVRQQVTAFRDHHDGDVVFDLKPVFFALPVMALGLYFCSHLIVSFALFAGVAEIAHYGAHRPERCVWLIHLLQWSRVFISPARHAKHHNGASDISYCVMSGWANPVVDVIARYVPSRGA